MDEGKMVMPPTEAGRLELLGQIMAMVSRDHPDAVPAGLILTKRGSNGQPVDYSFDYKRVLGKTGLHPQFTMVQTGADGKRRTKTSINRYNGCITEGQVQIAVLAYLNNILLSSGGGFPYGPTTQVEGKAYKSNEANTLYRPAGPPFTPSHMQLFSENIPMFLPPDSLVTDFKLRADMVSGNVLGGEAHTLGESDPITGLARFLQEQMTMSKVLLRSCGYRCCSFEP